MVRKTRCLVQIGSSTSDYEHSTNCLFNLYAFDHQIYRGREERNVVILPANGNHGSDCYRYIHPTAPERMRNPEQPRRNFAAEQITEPQKG